MGCILAAHDFLPYRELQMSGGSRTSSQSEGTLNGEGHLLGDVGRKRGSVGPAASLLRGRLAWCRAGLSHFPGLAGEGALCPVASALCLWPLQSLTGAVVWGLGTLIRSPCQTHGEFPGQVSCVPRIAGVGTTYSALIPAFFQTSF